MVIHKCDLCDKEIGIRNDQSINANFIAIYPTEEKRSAIPIIPPFKIEEVCTPCVEKIKKFIQSLKHESPKETPATENASKYATSESHVS